MMSIFFAGLAFGAFLTVILSKRFDTIFELRANLMMKGDHVLIGYILSTQFNQEEFKRLSKIKQSLTEVSPWVMYFKIWKPLTEESWLTKEQLEFLNLTFERVDNSILGAAYNILTK